MAHQSVLFAAIGVGLFYLWMNPEKIGNRGPFRLAFGLYAAAIFMVPLYAVFMTASTAKGMASVTMWSDAISWVVTGVAMVALFLSLTPAEPKRAGTGDPSARRSTRSDSTRKSRADQPAVGSAEAGAPGAPGDDASGEPAAPKRGGSERRAKKASGSSVMEVPNPEFTGDDASAGDSDSKDSAGDSSAEAKPGD